MNSALPGARKNNPYAEPGIRVTFTLKASDRVLNTRSFFFGMMRYALFLCSSRAPAVKRGGERNEGWGSESVLSGIDLTNECVIQIARGPNSRLRNRVSTNGHNAIARYWHFFFALHAALTELSSSS